MSDSTDDMEAYWGSCLDELDQDDECLECKNEIKNLRKSLAIAKKALSEIVNCTRYLEKIPNLGVVMDAHHCAKEALAKIEELEK